MLGLESGEGYVRCLVLGFSVKCSQRLKGFGYRRKFTAQQIQVGAHRWISMLPYTLRKNGATMHL